MAQVLSNENQLLLKTILDRKPESLKELEVATGRSSSNLSRTLKTMARLYPDQFFLYLTPSSWISSCPSGGTERTCTELPPVRVRPRT